MGRGCYGVLNETEVEKASCLQGVDESIAQTLALGTPDTRRVIASLDKLGQYLAADEQFLVSELMELGLSHEEALQTKKDSLAVLSAEESFKKIKRELGEFPFEISRLSTREEEFEGWMPMGVLGHVTSSNDAMLPFFSSVEGILTGNINVIKTASGAHKVAMAMVEKLCEIDESLCPYFYVFPLSSKDEDLLKVMFSLCNVIAVWGSDAATAGVRKLAPSGVSIVEWGNRISFAYNLSGNISIEEMVDTIWQHKINCLAGLPSILTKIVSYIEEHHLTGFTVDTVYFAGETLFLDQREKISRVFGREIDFRSVFYASNDGGPIGYYTKDCGFNEHRTMSDLTVLELIDPDTGEVITEMNKPGVIYITSLFKSLIPLIRYPAGDIAEYTEPEGIPDRKFRILGRSDVAARAGYVTLSPQDVGNVLKLCDIDHYSYQIIVEHDIRDRFTFRIAVSKTDDSKTALFLETLYRERPVLKDALNDGTLSTPIVEWCKPSDLEYNPRTGKLKAIIDKRI